MAHLFLRPALEYAKLGWAIFPCLQSQKVPATPHGVKDATSDPEQIKRWWDGNPKANIAVACGELSGIHVIDVDISAIGNINGWNSLNQLAKMGKILPKTVKQNTPRGGAHFFYHTNNPPANKNSFLPGIDIRSSGYYVVIAPSIHPNGGQYEWAPGLSPWDHKFAAFPDFMRPEMKPISQQDRQSTPLLPQPADDEVLKRASAYLATCDPAIQGEGGHDKLLWAAVTMVQGFLLSDNQAFELLEREYNPRCVPPWNLNDPRDYKDFRRKVTEARRLTSQHSSGWLLNNGDPSLVSYEDIKKIITNSKLSPIQSQERLRALASNVDDLNRELNFLVQPTGLVGDICSWINSTARKPQPFLTLGCVLAFCGVLFGRKIKDETGTRTNLYCMGIAHSSAGKKHAPTQIRRLCYDAGCFDLIGGDDFASDTSIEARLEINPATLFLCDEIGHLFYAIQSRTSSHTIKILPMLMKLYSLADSVYTGKEYAEIEKRRVLVEPCCCIYGTSTPEVFIDSFTPAELRDGWLSRCLVFYTDNDPQKRRGESIKQKAVSEKLVEQVSAWFVRKIDRTDDDEGDITRFVNAHGITTAVSPPQLVVPTRADAEKIFIDFDNETIKIAKDHSYLEYLWRKGEENARRIALIIAAGENFDNPVITSAIADYSCRLIRYLLIDFSNKVPGIAFNAVDRNKQKLLEIITEGGVSGCPRRQLTRKSQWLYGRERASLLADLIEAEQVIMDFADKKQCLWTPENYLMYMKQRQ